MSMKNSSDIIGNRTRDLPACSAVPQPTAPPRAPFLLLVTTVYTIQCVPTDSNLNYVDVYNEAFLVTIPLLSSPLNFAPFFPTWIFPFSF